MSLKNDNVGVDNRTVYGMILLMDKPMFDLDQLLTFPDTFSPEGVVAMMDYDKRQYCCPACRAPDPVVEEVTLSRSRLRCQRPECGQKWLVGYHLIYSPVILEGPLQDRFQADDDDAGSR
jgi:hypothetical protein